MAIKKKKVSKKKATKKKSTKKKVSKKKETKEESPSKDVPKPIHSCAICGSTDGIHPPTCFKHFMLGQHEKKSE